MNTELLKKKILDLAIRGKLVEQRPEEGTAEDLYQQIQEEKANLIKEGKLKKKKPLSPIIDEEIPFEVPKRWMWVRLENISLRLSDGPFGSNLKKEHYTENKEVRIIQLSNIGCEGWKNENCKYTTFEHLKTISRSEVFPGDIVIAKMMPAGRAIIVPNSDSKYVLSSDAVGVSLDKNLLEIKYINYAINSDIFRCQVCKEARGTTRIRTSLGKLKSYCLPLPPLAEQKRIVEKIDLLFSKLHTVEDGLVEIDKLSDLTKKKILDLAIRGKLVKQRPEECTAEDLYLQIQEEKANLIKEGKLKKKKPLAPIENDDIPFDLPESWKWVRIRDISLLVTKGTTPRGGNVAYTDKGVGFLRAENVNGLTTLNLSNLKFVSEKAHQNELKRSVLEDGDILVTIAGTLGRTAVVQSTDLPLNANQAISIVRMIFKSENMLKYAAFALNANTIQQILLRQTKQTAIPNLTLEIVGNCIIPLPPLAEQKRIVAKVEELLSLCDKLKLK